MSNAVNHTRDTKSSLLPVIDLHLVNSTGSSNDTVFVFVTTLYNSVPEAARINICYFWLIISRVPGYTLPQCKFVEIPYLNLIFGSVTANKQLPVVIVNWISCYVQAKDRFNWFSLADIPEMEYRVPTSRNYGVVINELNRENSVRMSSVVPLCASEICAYTFSIYFKLKLL